MAAIVRIASADDAPGMLRIYGPVVLETPISFETEVPAEAAFRDRIENSAACTPWLVCEVDGRIAGYAYAGRYREREAYQWTVESTVYVHEDFRRGGIGGALYRNLLNCLRAQGYLTVLAAIALPNPASVRLHERMGFSASGVYRDVGYKLGRWHDVGWWELKLGDAPSRPEPPRPLEAVLPGLRWEPPEG